MGISFWQPRAHGVYSFGRDVCYLKNGSDHQGPVCVESYTNPPGEQLQSLSQQRSACTACRNKKLKCTGHRNGCDRCRAKGIACTYLASSKIKRKSRQLYRPPSADSHQGSRSAQTLAVDREDMQPFEKSRQPLLSPQDSTIRSIIDGSDTARPMTDFTESSNESILAHTRKTDPLGTRTPVSDPAIGEEELDILESVTASDLMCSQELVPEMLGFDFDGLTSMEHRQSNDSPGALQRSCAQESRSSSSYLTEVSEQPRYNPFDSPLWSDDTLSHSKPRSFHRDNTHMANSLSMTPCQCMEKVLLLYEEIEGSRNEGFTLAMLDHRLNFQKNVLNRCSGILGCKNCRERSAIAMLLISICERLGRAFRSLLRSVSDKLLFERQQQRWLHSSLAPRAKVSETDAIEGYQRLYIGDYKVDAPQEQLLLVMRVVELQIRGLLGLEAQLKTIAMSNGWEKHTSILRPIQEQTQQIALSLKEVANNALDGSLHCR